MYTEELGFPQAKHCVLPDFTWLILKSSFCKVVAAGVQQGTSESVLPPRTQKLPCSSPGLREGRAPKTFASIVPDAQAHGSSL